MRNPDRRNFDRRVGLVLGGVLLAACCVATINPALAQSTTYRWVDAGGVTHYTQTPPPVGSKYDKIIFKAPKTEAAADSPPEASQDAAATNNPANAEAAQRKEACEKSQKNVKLLESDQPLLASPPTGAAADNAAKPALLNTDQRAEELRRAKLQVELYCQ